MSASRVNPNQWNGEERSGGYIARNTRATSANSPEFKGRIYLIGVGWYWISGWSARGRADLVQLRLQEMTDEQAEKFCKPKGAEKQHHAGSDSDSRIGSKNGNGGSDSDIPF